MCWEIESNGIDPFSQATMPQGNEVFLECGCRGLALDVNFPSGNKFSRATLLSGEADENCTPAVLCSLWMSTWSVHIGDRTGSLVRPLAWAERSFSYLIASPRS